MADKILIIDDSRTVHAVVKQHLASEPVEILSAFNGDAGLRLAGSIQPDLILLDVEMPTPDGLEVCRKLKLDPLTMVIPVIFLSGGSSTEQKIAGLNLGTVDYITKPFDPAELCARVRVSLRSKQMFDMLAKRAMIDGLTGLWNRAYLDTRLLSEISLAERSGSPLSCIMADVDHFKNLNDTYGHAVGDQVLRAFSQILLNECRGEDIVCRYGGEEFVILTPAVDFRGATSLAERLRGHVAAASFAGSSSAIHTTCSFGVAELTTQNNPRINLLRLADEALYEAKRAGRNRVITVPRHPLAQPPP